jgi:hypothetical protein
MDRRTVRHVVQDPPKHVIDGQLIDRTVSEIRQYGHPFIGLLSFRDVRGNIYENGTREVDVAIPIIPCTIAPQGEAHGVQQARKRDQRGDGD